MKPQTYLLPAIFVAVSNAQSSTTASACSAPSGVTIQNQGDVTTFLQDCTTFTGSVTIAPGTSEPINFPNVKSITGDLVADGASNLTSFSADNLQSIGGAFTLNDLTTLTQTSFPYLTSVGDLSFQGLPNLMSLGFTQSIKTVKTINIQNTFLSSLDGLNPQAVNSIYIANNRLLQTISFQVSSVSTDINILSNGDRLAVQFPNLMTARNITFINCPTVSINSLLNTTGALGFYSNTFSSISAVNLTSVGSLAINANTQLTNVSLPVLQTINGGFQVQNNTLLSEISMPALKTILGALDFYGNISSVSIPQLADCRGAFNIQSSSSALNCSAFNSEHSSSLAIKGKYFCMGNVSTPGNSSTNPTSANKGASVKNIASNSALLIIGAALALFMGTM